MCGTFVGSHFVPTSIPSHICLSLCPTPSLCPNSQPMELKAQQILRGQWNCQNWFCHWFRCRWGAASRGDLLFLEGADNEHNLCVPQPRALSTLGYQVHSPAWCSRAGTHLTKPGLSPGLTLRSSDFGQVTHSLYASVFLCKMGEITVLTLQWVCENLVKCLQALSS